MAKHDIVMPQMGESITNGTITKWHKKAGEEIKLDEVLLEISTDKVESEIPSPLDGRVWEILYEEGDTVDVGVKIAVVEDDLSLSFDGGASSEKKEKASKPTAKAKKTVATKAPSASSPAADSSDGRRFYTPLVRSLAQKHGIPIVELSNISGSGAGGRVNKRDFETYLKTRTATPSTSVSPSASSPVVSTVPAFSAGERVEIIPMDNMRKTIAKNMIASKLTSPHVNSVDEIDMSALVKFREGFKAEFKAQEGFSLTYTHFILYALVQTLKEFPMVNASVDGDNIVLKKDINLGCAVAVPGNGLVVPVVKSADSLNITGIARAVNDLAHRARAKKLTMEELSGGTFTFSNVGSFGTMIATPVILQPQVGIFACGIIKKRPIVTSEDAIAIRSMMYATHTYDHRLVDGEMGGLFLAAVKRHLEEMDPASLF